MVDLDTPMSLIITWYPLKGMALISLVDILSGISASLLRLRINTLTNFLRLVPCSQAWSSTSLGFYLRFQSQGVLMTR